MSDDRNPTQTNEDTPRKDKVSIIPPFYAELQTFFKMQFLYNPLYPFKGQAFAQLDKLHSPTNLGRDPHAYGRLGPILLASYFSCDVTDCRPFCCDFGDDQASIFMSSEEGFTHNIKSVIQQWASTIFEQRIQKSCVIVKFVAFFKKNEESIQAGHAITLGYDSGRFTIYDYRDVEYVHDVHKQLADMVQEAVIPYHFNHASSEHLVQVVSLKNKLQCDSEFMTCMSLAFRVCVCLTKGLPIQEDDSDFEMNKTNLQQHILAMLRWVHEKMPDQSSKQTVLISPEMSTPLFEINEHTCYLMLVPSEPSDTDSISYWKYSWQTCLFDKSD